MVRTKREPADAAVIDEARRQGVHRRSDLCRVRGEPYVQAQLDAHRWQTPLPHVVVTHNGPLTEKQRMWVVLIGGPPGTRLHGLSALAHDGLRRLEPDHLTVVIPGSSASPHARQLKLPDDWGVKVHWSTRLDACDVNARAIPPRTRPARSVVDAASERVAPRRARVIVLASVQQGLVVAGQLCDALSRRGRCRNRRIIVESIIDAGGGVQSLPEQEFAAMIRRLGLPEPRRQRIVRRRDGRYYLDAEWPELGIRVEIHGIPHSWVANWDDDLLRQNDIALDGGLLVFSSYALRHREERVEAQLLALFRRRGWSR
jgi:hypothetical protein